MHNDAEVLVFKSDMQASKWICFHQYEGTDGFTQKHPVLDPETFYKMREKWGENIKLMKMMDSAVEQDVAEMKSASDYLQELDAPDIMKFALIGDDKTPSIYDNYKWKQNEKRYPLSDYGRDKGYCFLCHHNHGMMVVWKIKDVVQPKGGMRSSCLHYDLPNMRSSRGKSNGDSGSVF
jgi:hypothetical protein